jgi:hypothetical protein
VNTKSHIFRGENTREDLRVYTPSVHKNRCAPDGRLRMSEHTAASSAASGGATHEAWPYPGGAGLGEATGQGGHVEN